MDMGIKTIRMPEVILHYSDHEPFKHAGIEAFCITAVTQEDVDAYKDYMIACTDKNASKKKLWKEIMHKRTKIFKNYHQPTDCAEHLSEKTLVMVSDLLEKSIRGVSNNIRLVGEIYFGKKFY